jgi:hypothetical protein
MVIRPIIGHLPFFFCLERLM